jgi:L,D-transpeptidase YbiS
MKYKKLFFNTLFILLAIFLVVEVTGFYIASRNGSGDETHSLNRKARGERLDELKAKNTVLKESLEGLFPRGVYIVIDTARSILYLKNKKRVIRGAIVSSGSGSILMEPNGRRQWVFDTTRGEYIIESKSQHPVWIRPDWAFIEEGKPTPKNAGDRLEEGALGDYALGFGNAYFIHGTLYTRLLGRNVTHGCVRLGDDDLKAVYTAADIGTKLYIY